MTTETTRQINFDSPAVIEEAQEAIDEVFGKEPDINDNFAQPVVIEDDPEEESQEIPSVTDDSDSPSESNKEEGDEQCNAIVEETYSEVSPLFDKSRKVSQAQREYYRQIGVIVNERKKQVEGNGHGEKFMSRLSTKLGISISTLQGICSYAKADPNGNAIPENLIGLSWRRVVACARKARTEAKFKEILEGNPDLITRSTEEFDKLLKEIPNSSNKGRKGKKLDSTDAGKQAGKLGGGTDTESEERKPLPEKVEEAKNALVELGEDLPERIKVRPGVNGFDFDATFRTEEECVKVFQHFIEYLEVA